MSYRYIVQRLFFLNKVSKILKKENYDKIIIENHTSLFLSLKWKKNYKKYESKYYYHLHNEILNDYRLYGNNKKVKKNNVRKQLYKKTNEKIFKFR